jgi:hypothetical protein
MKHVSHLKNLIQPLKVEKELKHLSPSAIGNAKNQPNTFYLNRLVLDALPREPQSLAAGVGTAFDILIKRHLINDKNIYCPIEMEEIEASLQNEEIREEAFKAAEELMKMYRNSRLVALTKWVQIEGVFAQEYTFNGRCIPLICKLDAVVYDKEYGFDVPLDWKCSGYTSEKGVSPKPKFKDKFDGKTWVGPHKDYTTNMHVTELPADWARQFTLYGMCLNKLNHRPDWTEFPVHVHHPIFNGTGKKPMVAVYRAIVTSDFQREIWEEVCQIWDSIKEDDGNRFLERLCVSFGGPLGLSIMSSYASECESYFSTGKSNSANDQKMGLYK